MDKAKSSKMREKAYSKKKTKTTEGSEKANTAPAPSFHSIPISTHMMATDITEVTAAFKNQESQCIQFGNPISFISSLTPDCFS